MKRSRFK